MEGEGAGAGEGREGLEVESPVGIVGVSGWLLVKEQRVEGQLENGLVDRYFANHIEDRYVREDSCPSLKHELTTAKVWSRGGNR